MSFEFSSNVTFERPLQPIKADFSIDVTLAGITISFKLIHAAKTPSPIVVTLAGITISSNLSH